VGLDGSEGTLGKAFFAATFPYAESTMQNLTVTKVAKDGKT
jgi:hypothetical protein